MRSVDPSSTNFELVIVPIYLYRPVSGIYYLAECLYSFADTIYSQVELGFIKKQLTQAHCDHFNSNSDDFDKFRERINSHENLVYVQGKVNLAKGTVVGSSKQIPGTNQKVAVRSPTHFGLTVVTLWYFMASLTTIVLVRDERISHKAKR